MMISPLFLSLIALAPVLSLTLVYVIVMGIQSWFGIELLPLLRPAEK